MAPNRRDVIRLGAASGLLAGLGAAGVAQARPSMVRRAAVTDTVQWAHPAGGMLILDPRAPSLSLVVAGITRWLVADFGPNSGQLNGPTALAVHPDGRCFVANTGNHEVLVFSGSGTPLAAWGGLGAAPGRFRGPRGLALDAQGNLWVADALNHRLQVLDSNGEFLRVVGGVGALGDATGPRLNGPADLALAGDGSVWVADTGNHRLARYVADTGAWVGFVALADAPRAVAVDARQEVHAAVVGAVLSFDARGNATARWPMARPVTALSWGADCGLMARTA